MSRILTLRKPQLQERHSQSLLTFATCLAIMCAIGRYMFYKAHTVHLIRGLPVNVRINSIRILFGLGGDDM